MNEWVEKSIELATTTNYLDKLHKIYPIESPEFRTVDDALLKEIADAHSSKNPVELVSTLLQLEKFPIDDPYIGFLRVDEDAVKRNVATVKRIGEWLLGLKLEQVLSMSAQPKRAVKQYGEAFKKWWLNSSYSKLDESKFAAKTLPSDKVFVHGGTPEEWKRFANSVLDCGLVKAPDLLARKGKKFIISETKFLTSFGGGQNDFFDEAITFVRQVHGNAHRIAILDGPLWLPTENKQSLEVRRLQADAMSALLLQEFLDVL
jgi:hypothetical protein